MEAIKIEGIEDHPDVCFDKENNILQITGKSLPEDALEFYSPLINWLDEYMRDPNEQTILELKVHYFNTASSKMILFMLEKLNNMNKMGHHVEVHWYYIEDDEDMLEAGEIYAERVDFGFKIIPM